MNADEAKLRSPNPLETNAKLAAPRTEWPTLALLAACYAAWLATTWLIGVHGIWPLVIVAIAAVTLHSSMQHEVLHGHPTPYPWLNELLVTPAVGIVYPYRRFETLHLMHHRNEYLTDPFEDPESWYRSPTDMARASQVKRAVLNFANTLTGRMLLGPLLGVYAIVRHDAAAIWKGDRTIAVAWLMHVAGLAPVLYWIVAVCGFHPLVYLFAIALPGFSVLQLRVFAEHRAHEDPAQRSVIVERAGIFGLLFLNNHLHFVHHAFPGMAWYRLPKIYQANREQLIAANGGYVFPNYWAQFRAYAFRRKEPVIHPLM